MSQLLGQPPLQPAQYHVQRGVPYAVRLRPEPGLGSIVKRKVQLPGRYGEDSPVRCFCHSKLDIDIEIKIQPNIGSSPHA